MSSHENQNASRIVDDEIDLGQLLGKLVDGRWWILSITSIFIVFGIVYALFATPIYQANGLLQIEKKSAGASLLGDMGDFFGEQSDVGAEIELLKSRMVLGQTVDELNLTTQVGVKYFPFLGQGWARLTGKPIPEILISRFEVHSQWMNVELELLILNDHQYRIQVDDLSLQGQKGQILSSNGIELLVSDFNAEAGTTFTIKKASHLRVINSLKSSLSVTEIGKNTGIISLRFEGGKPEYIRTVIDSISQNYLRQNINRKSEEAQRSLDFLASQLPEIHTELNEAEEKLNHFRRSNDSIDLSLEAKAALDTLIAIEKQLNELTFKEAEIQQLYTTEHPAYIALNEKREALYKSKEDVNILIKRLPSTQQEILRLTRDVEVGQQVFVQLLNKQQELSILKAGTVGNVRIVDTAVVEPIAVKPKRKLIVLIATLLGGMISVGFILLRAALRKGIENPEVIEDLGIAVYTSIPLSSVQSDIEEKLKLKKQSSITETLLAIRDPADLAMEAIRGLRTSLHFAMLEASNNIIMISGPAPSLGKSFVSSNLAAALANNNKKVLVVDGDLRKGYMRKSFGQINAFGLSDYLAGQCSREECINVIKEVPGLDFIGRGAVPPNPAELLMHPRFKELLDWANEQYDFVLIDSPPILAVTDGAIIGRHAGTSLLVARFRETTIKELQVAISRFEQSGVPIKGVLFNAVEKTASGYYGQYSYYQYAYTSDNTKD